MVSAPQPLLSPPRERWIPAGLFAVIALSACTAPLYAVGGLTLTGDRLLGLLAVIAVVALAITRNLRWTPIHTTVAAFTGIQVLTSLVAASVWPAGPKFSAVYVFGFACFALAAELAARAADPWTGARLWIGIGAVLGLVGAGLAVIANRWQVGLWGIGEADYVRGPTSPLILFAARLTFSEWNLYSSFLLVAFALALWRWRSGEEPPWHRGSGFLALSAIALGLVFGMTRAAWIGMAALLTLWAWARRPGWQPAAALVGVVIAGFAAQTVAIGITPLYARVVQPVQSGKDRNIEGRRVINRATLESWRGAPARAPTPEPPRDRDEREKDGVGADDEPVKRRPEAATSPVGPGTPGAKALNPQRDRSTTIPPSVEPPAVGLRNAEAGRWRGRMFGNGAGSINALYIRLPSEQALSKPWNGNLPLFVLHDSGAIGLVSLAGLVVAVALMARSALRRATDSSARALLVALLGAGVVLLFAYQFTHALWLMYPYVYLGLLAAALARHPLGPDVPPRA